MKRERERWTENGGCWEGGRGRRGEGETVEIEEIEEIEEKIGVALALALAL